MIGTRALASGAGSVLVVAALLGDGGADPSAARHAEQLVRERARAALDALDALAAGLAPALDSAREGASLAVQGDEPPGPPLEAAAETVEEAGADADAARRAVSALDGARRALDPGTPGLPPAIDGVELGAVAAELRAAAPAAAAVAELRRGARRLLEGVDRSLAALADGMHGAARAEIEAARAEHDALVASGAASDALPVWLDATDAMITVVTNQIEATEAGDRAAAAAAAEEFAALAEDAATADRALAIAMSEGAASATGPAVQRLGALLSSVEELRASIAPLAGRP
jgi:hypothetical protein